MTLQEQLRFRTITAVMWFIGIVFVLTIHKWSIESMHERLKTVEAKLEVNEVTQ